ncbi:MAG TPA: flavin reductase family protein [Thermoplasmata archaeon]|nr:flavin reductase family protein [Thermoplasmata archaeon]
MSPSERDRFRSWMGLWPTGVSVVTAADGRRPFGMTVNAFLSVSLEPPTVLVSLANDADSTPVILRTRRFAVNLLAHDQRALSECFAQAIPAAEKFAGLPTRPGQGGVPLLEATLGALECAVGAVHPAADHQLVLGTVEELHEGRSVPPLLFHRSRYAEADGAGALTLASAPPKA